MSFRNQRNFRNNREKRRIDEEDKNEEQSNNPVIQQFKEYSKELDNKHDRHERLVKISRDITIEAKRIIFLLHNIDARKNNKERVLTEAKERIDKLIANNFALIAKELKNHEIFQFMRAVSPGIQEFIEALTFYEFLAEKEDPSTWEEVQEKMKYKDGDDGNEYSLFLCPIEFILGYADLTGEVMRYCINSLGSAEIDNCFKTCKFLQHVYAKFLTISSVPNHGRDFSHKLSTMKMSTLKSEHVCYQLKIRGTEGAKFPSLNLDFSINNDDVDEGFY
ncbi:hypothetical protein PVAND_001192 [Polypedilum vanderplanki]|uniref:Translin-associated protein X n=1 Tax=Polypedilum vanderplanki TaxID=319348 RepID=A0A9J6BNF9_POLVA|nr:hypothetical protein PVAND_001192 [Polypedilum vanderplanki]